MRLFGLPAVVRLLELLECHRKQLISIFKLWGGFIFTLLCISLAHYDNEAIT